MRLLWILTLAMNFGAVTFALAQHENTPTIIYLNLLLVPVMAIMLATED